MKEVEEEMGAGRGEEEELEEGDDRRDDSDLDTYGTPLAKCNDDHVSPILPASTGGGSRAGSGEGSGGDCRGVAEEERAAFFTGQVRSRDSPGCCCAL